MGPKTGPFSGPQIGATKSNPCSVFLDTLFRKTALLNLVVVAVGGGGGGGGVVTDEWW